ncbi:hypothetical protein D9758_014900 [Tetrapyrgos nigripes]|uniref:Uncharacterized protein n=1 Tax=Tetrapyrgos nigripes TaxID=182062 RepID=A0A8H5CFQ9_9AGAR|nr:hypothetical protein D9758_014900 [Tetrapyrgos nigripes]
MDAYRNQLTTTQKAFNTFLRRRHKNETRREEEQLQAQWLSHMQKICNIIREAGQAGLSDTELDELARIADGVLDKGIEYCYGEDGDITYDAVPSFAHTPEGGSAPIVKDTHSRLGSGTLNSFLSFMTRSGLFGDMTPATLPPEAQEIVRGPKNWYDLIQPFPNNTPLSRFYGNLPALSYTAATPNATSVLQARCEIASDSIANPIRMALSSGGSMIAIAGASGYKERSPALAYSYIPRDGQGSDLTVHDGKIGLSDIGRHVETDEERKLIFIADEARIKSYDWSGFANPDDAGEKLKRRRGRGLLPKHTMRSAAGVEGPMLMLSNGRLARAGKGKVAIWDLDGLQTHGPEGKDEIGEREGEEDEEDEMFGRDDYEDIEHSPGSRSNQLVRFSFDPDYDVEAWVLHPGNPSMVLCAQDSMKTRKYGMVMVDLEAGGKEVGRFIGHGAGVTKITTGGALQEGQGGHVFCTGCSEGMARIYDVRQRVPVLTVEGDIGEGSCSAVLAYPDGIPVIFTGAMATTQCIRTWDIRAKAVVYELSTGNNDVQDLAWDTTRNTLYAATSCKGLTRTGYYMDYRKAKIPQQQLGKFGFPDSLDEDEEEDYDDGDDQYCWPEKAYNAENHFGYMFDAGMHSLFRYKFSPDADVDFTPGYGQVRIERGGGFW